MSKYVYGVHVDGVTPGHPGRMERMWSTSGLADKHAQARSEEISGNAYVTRYQVDAEDGQDARKTIRQYVRGRERKEP